MSSNSSTDSHGAGGAKVTGFVVLTILALAVCGAALYLGGAPVKSTYVDDWIGWVRSEQTWPGVFAVAFIVLLIGVFGGLIRLIAGVGNRSDYADRARSRRPTLAPEALAMPAEKTASRGSLKFDAQSLEARDTDSDGLTIPAVAAKPALADSLAEPPSLEIQSLEPAIFSDNASDSFLTFAPAEVETQPVAAPAAEAEVIAFNPDDALSDTHGLHVVAPAPETTGEEPASAQVIPIRPDVQIAAPSSDPLEAALLADAPASAPRDVPPSDIHAVISSAMRFIETPEVTAAPVTQAVETLPEAPPTAPQTNGFHEAAAAFTPSDDQAIIRQAVQMALSVWPDSTRAIAADELSVRITHLYHDKSQQSVRAFQQIASGDLSAAASTLQLQADLLSAIGSRPEAAEVWRVIGALHMGRDDPKALNAYEKVSELDPTDANIHVYLARRYMMAGETAKLQPVLRRALTVVGDPATRLELLAPYADLLIKAGDSKSAGDAFEELGRLHETRAYLKPDDVSARSAQGVSLARGAQAREMHGAFDQAGPLYKKAYGVFADLSARLPEHAGLKAMADNALRDAQRFNMA